MIVGLAVALSALQAQNTVTVSDVSLLPGESAVISVELANETMFSAFQMDLKLPEGFEIPTTFNEDDDEVLDIVLSVARKKSTHSLSYNIFEDGTVRIASFSSTNATYKGSSGEILQIRIVPTDDAVAGANFAELTNVLFITNEAVEYNLGRVNFVLNYKASVPDVPVPDVPELDTPINEVRVNDLCLSEEDVNAALSVELTNETEFSAFQMDLMLPKGFEVATTLNEDNEEMLDVELSAARKKSTHSLSYNILPNGTIRIASFSSTNAVFKGTSGEIVQFRIVPTADAIPGNHIAMLSNMLFTTPEAVDYRMPEVCFQISYTPSSFGEEVDSAYSVQVNAGPYGRCIWNGIVIEPNEVFAQSSVVASQGPIKLYFTPFDGYRVSSMKRNGELVSICDNMYEEPVTEDVSFTDVCYVSIVDTFVVTETVVDTLVLADTIIQVDTLVKVETVVELDTLVITETVVDTFVVTETVVDTLILKEVVCDTVLVEKTDTMFITEIAELPTPVITCDNGMVTIACEDSGVIILYAVNGDPMEGCVYSAPFEVTEDAVVSAVAVRSGEKAELEVMITDIVQSSMRVVSRRYFTENGVEVTSLGKGITIVATEYENGSTRVDKIVQK